MGKPASTPATFSQTLSQNNDMISITILKYGLPTLVATRTYAKRARARELVRGHRSCCIAYTNDYNKLIKERFLFVAHTTQ